MDKGKNKHCPGIYTGYFGLMVIDKIEDIKNGNISVHGYPGDKCSYKNHEMWGKEIKVNNTVVIRNGIVEHQIDTYGGQSGSGLIFRKQNNYYIFGIHVRGKQKYNEATLITEKRLKNIENWIIKGLLKFENMFKNEIKKYISTEIKNSCLNFFGLDFINKWMKYLTQMKLEYLSEITFYCSQIGNEAMKYLSEMKLENLLYLKLQCNNIGYKGMEYLSKTKLENLKELDLSSNQIKAEGIKYLSQMKLDNLRNLNLNYNDIGDKGIKYLSQMNLEKLEKLDLASNNISAEGFKSFPK